MFVTIVKENKNVLGTKIIMLDITDNINPAIKTYLRNDILREGVNDDTIGLALALDDNSSIFSSAIHQSSSGTGLSKHRGDWQLENLQSEAQLIHRSHDRAASHSKVDNSRNMEVNSKSLDVAETKSYRKSNSIGVHVNNFSGNLFSSISDKNDIKPSVQNSKKSKCYQGGSLKHHLESNNMVDKSSMNEIHHDDSLQCTQKKIDMKQKFAIEDNGVDFDTLFKVEPIIVSSTLNKISEYTQEAKNDPIIIIKEKIVEKNSKKKKVSQKKLNKEEHYMNINEDNTIFEANGIKKMDLTNKANKNEDSLQNIKQKILSMKKKKKKKLLETIQDKITDSKDIEERTKYEKIHKLVQDSLLNKKA